MNRLCVQSLLMLSLFSIAAFSNGQPATPMGDEAKAIEQFRAGKYEEALESLKLATKANAKLPPARVIYADLFYKAGNGRRARQELERAATEDPTHPDVYNLNGTYALTEGRVTDAILSFESALKLVESPRWTPAEQKRLSRSSRLGLANAYQARGDYKQARAQLQVLLQDEPKNGPLRQQTAATAFLSGLPDVAEKELNAAFADDPTLDPPELTLARLAQGKRDPAKAEEWYKKAVVRHPKSVKASRGYAEWLLDRGRLDEATPHLENCAKLDANSPETAAVLGLAARYRKDFASAEKIFESLHRDSPGNAFFGWNLAISLAESDDSKKRDRAVQLADALSRQFPREAEGVAVLGWCLFKAGRTEEAAQAFQTRANVGAFGADTAYFIARLLESKGNLVDSKRLLKDALAQTDAFVYRKDAESLLADIEKRQPTPPEEPKKP